MRLMQITRVTPPTGGGTIWSGEAVSPRQHYFWLAEHDGGGCAALSGELADAGNVSRNGVALSRFYKSLRRSPPALATAVRRALAQAIN